MALLQHTLDAAVTLQGIGVHTGQPATVTISPAPVDNGLVFWRGTQRIPVVPDAVSNTTMCTEIRNPQGASVKTIEHLLAALYAAEITNADIHITGPEVPILDGSSLPFTQVLRAMPQDSPCPVLHIATPYTFPWGWVKPLAHAHPSPWQSDTLHLGIAVDLPGIIHDTYEWQYTPAAFQTEIAPARTFCRQADVERLRAAGLIQGGTLDCALVFQPNGTPHPDTPPRFPDEPLRHKILDLLGDLAVGGRRIIGHIWVNQPGHTQNHRVLQDLGQAYPH